MCDKCCRTCHFYNNGICDSDAFEVDVYDSYVNSRELVENGYLDAVVSETAESINYDRMFGLLRGLLGESRVSQKKTKEIEEELRNFIEESMAEQLRRKFNNSIEKLLNNHEIDVKYDITVVDERETYCSNWR